MVNPQHRVSRKSLCLHVTDTHMHKYMQTSICPSIHLSVRPSIHPLSIHPSIPPSLRPSVPPSLRPSVRLSVRPFIHTYIWHRIRPCQHTELPRPTIKPVQKPRCNVTTSPQTAFDKHARRKQTTIPRSFDF